MDKYVKSALKKLFAESYIDAGRRHIEDGKPDMNFLTVDGTTYDLTDAELAAVEAWLLTQFEI